MAIISRGFSGRRSAEAGKLPPGQYLTATFPVLSAGPTPRVSLDNNGNATIARKGRTVQLNAGQSMRLSPGERVVCADDGSLVISERNSAGGTITTTLRKAGPGVDVSVEAHAVQKTL